MVTASTPITSRDTLFGGDCNSDLADSYNIVLPLYYKYITMYAQYIYENTACFNA